MIGSSHHYLFDAVSLLDDCITKLQITIEHDSGNQHDALYEMKDVLLCAEHLLHDYLDRMIVKESRGLKRRIDPPTERFSIKESLELFQVVLKETRRQDDINQRKIRFLNPQDPFQIPRKNTLYTTRSATDSLLFRLIVALQLCLVRIDDAHLVLTGRRIKVDDQRKLQQDHNEALALGAGICCCFLGAGMALLSSSPRDRRVTTTRWWKELVPQDRQPYSIQSLVLIGGVLVWGGRAMNKHWQKLWMTDKIFKSRCEIEEWTRQWETVQNEVSPRSQREQLRQELDHLDQEQNSIPDLMDDKSRRLIEYAMKNSPKSYFWQSQGELRFLMLKRFMDVYYASVGTALGSSSSSPRAKWQVPLITGAAASFYSITGTGASLKASQVVNQASRELIQHAWGMVSLPSIKNLMLQASRLLKGASVADRLEIAGVPCFVLSRDPAPELAAALTRQVSRNGNPTRLLSRMSTISETTSEDPAQEFDVSQRRFAGSCGQYRQRDVIFHLTGGGFFAHTIASDLPYLLDWSASTGAVVICPEYALLPEHTFPVALQQILGVYSALVDGVDLGFEVNRIIVTGESAGGNLAAALCVHLGMEQLETKNLLNESIESGDECLSTETIGEEPTRMPNAIMLSCPALNLTLEMSHSRVVGTEDPVLPSGLISAISDAYLPEGFSKSEPLASPFFAPDDVLKLFPPVLLFAGSHDPLLDDSVAFNERLRRNGVSSELRAAHNLPHAYWGLGTAGFPEARQVQQECQDWLKRQFMRQRNW